MSIGTFSVPKDRHNRYLALCTRRGTYSRDPELGFSSHDDDLQTCLTTPTTTPTNISHILLSPCSPCTTLPSSMATYSAFFSSGLLAPPLSLKVDLSSLDRTPSTPSPSPAFDDASDIDIDIDGRGTTQAQSMAAPRLRKRRSSLSINQSAMNIIKSPSRNAGNAFTVQRHLSISTSPSRSRSGSLTSVTGFNNVASQGTSLVGRMRSGSVGTALRPASRKPMRRAHTTAPSLPAPAVPLPELPAKFAKFASCSRQPLLQGKGSEQNGMPAFRFPNNSIDEEMKEN